MVSETKIDDTDTIFNGETQFLMEVFRQPIDLTGQLKAGEFCSTQDRMHHLNTFKKLQ